LIGLEIVYLIAAVLWAYEELEKDFWKAEEHPIDQPLLDRAFHLR
jgi:hypothetical protein